MKCTHHSLLLLLLCIGYTHGTAHSYSHLQLHRSSTARAALRERDSVVPPLLNDTEALCLQLSFPAIASSFSEQCGVAFSQMLASPVGSEEEKSAREDACTADCTGKVMQFLNEECQQPILAASLEVLCTELDGVPCHYITDTYNWTGVQSNCILSPSGSAEQCSEKCHESVSVAVEAIGCCTNYDHLLFLWTAECALTMPQLCPDPFAEKEDGTKEGGEKSKGEEMVDKPGEEETSSSRENIAGYSGSNAMSTSTLSLSVLTLLCVFLTCK